MKHLNRYRQVFAILAGIAVLIDGSPTTARAESAEERGLAISIEADRRSTGFGDVASVMIMTLRNRHGQESFREMRYRAMERQDDGDVSMIIFDDPADVKGTALLTHSHKTAPDEQWLYLPALKRVKRIAASDKSGPFMGSEFAYEDLSSQDVEKYTHAFLREETIDGRDHFVIQRVPLDKKSGYTRQVVWLDSIEYRIHKIEYYDRKGSLSKTLTIGNYQQYLGKYWRAHRMEMTNHQTGKSTTLQWSDYNFENSYTALDFNRNSLLKVR